MRSENKKRVIEARWHIVKGNPWLSGTLQVALLLIIIGVAWLGFNVGWFPAEYRPLVISVPMFLALVGLGNCIRGRFVSGTVLLLLGGFIMIPLLQDVFPGAGIPDISFRTYWPVLLIVAGLWAVVGMLCKGRCCCKHIHHPGSRCCGSGKDEPDQDVSPEMADRIEKDVAFNSSRQIILSSDFSGGEANVAFGEMILDMSRVASLNADNRLELNVFFGSAVIYVPSGWDINIVKSETFAGTIEDARHSRRDPQADAPVLKLKCAVAFGNIVIRNM